MSLLSSIQLGVSGLAASQIGLQVVGNNISNANTPGYIRQDVNYTPAPPHRLGGLILGLGVQVDGVVQKIDRFLAERLRDANGDLKSGEIQEQVYTELETILGELGDNDLSTALTSFFGALNNVLNQPEDAALRNIAVLEGEALAGDVRRLSGKVRRLYQDVNQQIGSISGEVNRLVRQIADLNLRIVNMEGGGTIKSDAVGLRDERQIALNELAQLIDITSSEQEFGSVGVYVGGDFLVFEGISREVETIVEPVEGGLATTQLQVKATGSRVRGSNGSLGGLTTARDEIIQGYLTELDEFARVFIEEFNEIHASGQGLVGFSELTGEFEITDSSLVLDQGQLPFTPDNGSFRVQIYSEQSDAVEVTDISVQLNGLDGDTTFNDLTAALDAVDGISATIDPTGRLTIASDSPTIQFAFSNDTSGVLTTLGLNTFFSGSSAADIGVSQILTDDPKKLATSQEGIGQDSEIASQLAGLLDAPLDSQGGDSLGDRYDVLVETITQGAAVTRSVTAGLRSFHGTLESQHLSITGVNIDEEAVRMITLQRGYQASAQFINTISGLLDDLLALL